MKMFGHFVRWTFGNYFEPCAQENIFGNEIENMPRFSKVNCIATLCRSCYSTGSKFCTRDSFFHPSVYISSYIRIVVMSTGHVLTGLDKSCTCILENSKFYMFYMLFSYIYLYIYILIA